MSDSSLPINLARLETKATLADAGKRLAMQVLSEARMEESMEEAFNPAAVEQRQARLNRFRRLDDRRRPSESENRKVLEVSKRSEEDLAHQFQKRNHELPFEKLSRLLNELRRAAINAAQVLKSVQEAFRDPTLADEAMEFLELAAEGDPNLQDAVRQARTILNEQKGREILAGRNVDQAAKAFHEKGIGESPTELRDLYRDVTGNPRDHNVLFSELSEQYPFDQLKLVVAFLLKGLGFDLKSKGPSIQQAELVRMMTEVRNLQSILWVYLFFKSRMKLIRSLFSKYGTTFRSSLTFELIAKRFIELVEERYPSVMKLFKQAEQMGLDDAGKIIIFMQYRDAIRGLSPRVYRSLKHRQDLLLMILEGLEELEAAQEEEEEGDN